MLDTIVLGIRSELVGLSLRNSCFKERDVEAEVSSFRCQSIVIIAERSAKTSPGRALVTPSKFREKRSMSMELSVVMVSNHYSIL